MKNQFDLFKYLACFEFTSFGQVNKIKNKKANDDRDSDTNYYFNLNKNISPSDKSQLSSFLFMTLLNKDCKFDADLFQNFLQHIPLNKIQLLVSLKRETFY